MSTPLAVFGPGILIAQRTDITLPSPINVGYVQEFSLEVAGTTKQLFGQKQFPLVSARSTVKVTGKMKNAVVSGIAMNAMFYGETAFATGGWSWNIDSTYSVPATTAYTVTVGSSTSFEADLGVKYAASGLPFQRVTTGTEAAGQYSRTANVYNFAAADASAALKITWAQVAASGQSLIVTNKDIGTTPTFQLDYYTNLNQPTSKPYVVRVYAAVASKHSQQFKLEDFMMPEFEFDLFANSSDQVYAMMFPEVS